MMSEKVMIRRTPSVCGGRPRVRDTRIPVWLVVGLRTRGASDAEILNRCPDLTQADLDEVWSFYPAYREEIDRDVRARSRA
jgi:uncharacterized protein (DUF433 family)